MKLDRELALILEFFSFWLGACIGSFLNVVIWRVPRGESIARPPSHCPKCGSPIKWWQNLPILSWLALRGRCASCHAPISPRYILIETLGGVLFLAAFLHMLKFGLPLHFLVVYWIWIALMIVGSFIDFDHQLLPDFVTVGGMALGLVANAYDSFFFWGKIYWENYLLYCVGGLAFGFGLLWLVRWIGSKAFRREAMGMGDVFLMGAVGALFGPVAVLGDAHPLVRLREHRRRRDDPPVEDEAREVRRHTIRTVHLPRLPCVDVLGPAAGPLVPQPLPCLKSLREGVAQEAQFLVYYPPFCPRWAG